MTSPSLVNLSPLRAARREGVPSFEWNHAGNARAGWADFCKALRKGSGRWSALSPDGGRLSALVLLGRGEKELQAVVKVLSGEGHARSGRDGRLQWAGELAHVAGLYEEGWMAVLPLAYPVDVGTPATRAAWLEAATSAAGWVSSKAGTGVSVAGPAADWPLPWTDGAAQAGAAAFVQDMQVAREGQEAVMIKARLVQDAPKGGYGVERLKLQVGPTAWHLTKEEAQSLLEQLQKALGGDAPGDAKKKRK